MTIAPFPEAFPNQGRYRTYAAWQHNGYADEPQYPGQMPVRYPEDASLLEIQLGGYIQ